MQELRFGSFSNGFKTLVRRKRVLVRSTRTCLNFIFWHNSSLRSKIKARLCCLARACVTHMVLVGHSALLNFSLMFIPQGWCRYNTVQSLCFRALQDRRCLLFCQEIMLPVHHPVWDLYYFIVLKLIFNEFEEIKVPRVRNWLCSWTPCVLCIYIYALQRIVSSGQLNHSGLGLQTWTWFLWAPGSKIVCVQDIEHFLPRGLQCFSGNPKKKLTRMIVVKCSVVHRFYAAGCS